jgi:hypothetical protein
MYRPWLTQALQHRDKSPISIRPAGDHYDGGVFVSCAWIKAKHVLERDPAYQKVKIAFAVLFVSRLLTIPPSASLYIFRMSCCGFCLPQE